MVYITCTLPGNTCIQIHKGISFHQEDSPHLSHQVTLTAFELLFFFKLSIICYVNISSDWPVLPIYKIHPLISGKHSICSPKDRLSVTHVVSVVYEHTLLHAVIVDAGSRYEVNYTSGVSHLLNRLAFQVRLLDNN